MYEHTERALAWSSRAIPLSIGVLMELDRMLLVRSLLCRSVRSLSFTERNVSCLGLWTKRESLRDHTRRATPRAAFADPRVT